MSCPQCTFENSALLNECELCQCPLKVEDPLIKDHEEYTKRYTLCVECTVCSFQNRSGSLQCSMCHSVLRVTDANSTTGNGSVEDKSISLLTNRDQYTSNAISIGGFEDFDSKQRTDGIIPILRQALDEQTITDTNGRNSLTTEYKLISPTPHITQKNAHGYNWACGYRNLQMLCLSLNSNPLYKKYLFNGDGKVPDIHGLQGYIERAWDAGFDSAGKSEFPNGLIGGDDWIGPTEVCSLLRYFGLRTHVIDITDKNEMRNLDQSQNKFVQKNYICDLCNESIHPNGKRWTCTVRNDYDVCSECSIIPQPYEMKLCIPSPLKPVPYQSQNISKDKEANSSICQSSSRKRTPTKSIYRDDFIYTDDLDGFSGEYQSGLNKVSTNATSATKVESANSIKLMQWMKKYFDYFQGTDTKINIPSSLREAPALYGLESSTEINSKDPSSSVVGMKKKHSEYKVNVSDVNESPLKKKNISISAECSISAISSHSGAAALKSTADIAASLPPEPIHISHEYQSLSGEETIVHPVYLQHQGHSRTVIGYEKNIRTNIHSLLLYDPACSGNKLKYNLIHSPSGWQRSIKRGLHTFRHGSYQILFVSGIMTTDERESAKIIVGESPDKELGKNSIRSHR
jgi:hypothetical protein